MNKTTLKKFLSFVFLAIAAPTLVFAQPAPTPPTTNTTSGNIVEQCNTGIYNIIDLARFPMCFVRRFILPLIISIGVIFFMWRLLQYMRKADDKKVRQEMPTYVLYAIVGLFSMLAIVSIVQLIGSTTGIGQGGGFNPPQFPTQ